MDHAMSWERLEKEREAWIRAGWPEAIKVYVIINCIIIIYCLFTLLYQANIFLTFFLLHYDWQKVKFQIQDNSVMNLLM